jgi:hypothetical protein
MSIEARASGCRPNLSMELDRSKGKSGEFGPVLFIAVPRLAT